MRKENQIRLKKISSFILAIIAVYGFTACVKVAQIEIDEIPTEYDYNSHDFDITTNIDCHIIVNATGNDLTREYRNDTVYYYNSWLTVKEAYVHNPQLINVHLEENNSGKERNFRIEVFHGPGNFMTEDYILITQLPKPKEESEGK